MQQLNNKKMITTNNTKQKEDMLNCLKLALSNQFNMPKFIRNNDYIKSLQNNIIDLKILMKN